MTVTVNIDSVDESLLVKPDGATFISEAMHREEDCEATFEGGINGTISVGLREANLDRRDRYPSKVYEPLAEAALSQAIKSMQQRLQSVK